MTGEWQYFEFILGGLGIFLVTLFVFLRTRAAKRSVPGNQLRENMEKMRKEAPFKGDHKK